MRLLRKVAVVIMFSLAAIVANVPQHQAAASKHVLNSMQALPDNSVPVLFGGPRACNYSARIVAARQFFNQRTYDNPSSGVQRGVVIHTSTYVAEEHSELRWYAMVMLPNSTEVAILSRVGYSPYIDGARLDALVQPGDLVLFNNADQDFRLSFEEVEVEGHGVFRCN